MAKSIIDLLCISRLINRLKDGTFKVAKAALADNATTANSATSASTVNLDGISQLTFCVREVVTILDIEDIPETTGITGYILVREDGKIKHLYNSYRGEVPTEVTDFAIGQVCLDEEHTVFYKWNGTEFTLVGNDYVNAVTPSQTTDSVVLDVDSEGGKTASATITAATTLKAGVMTAADKTKLGNIDGCIKGLAASVDASKLTLATRNVVGLLGTATVPAATTTAAGMMTAEDRTNLNSCIKEIAVQKYTSEIDLQTTDVSGEATLVKLTEATTNEAGVMGSGDKYDLTVLTENMNTSKESAALNHEESADTVTISLDDCAIVSDDSLSAVIPAASTSVAGVMSAADKTKLESADSCLTGITLTASATQMTITSQKLSGGTSIGFVSAASATAAGLMTALDKRKLNAMYDYLIAGDFSSPMSPVE